MASWSRRRKSIYALVAIAIFVVVFGGLAFSLFYKAPSCFDGVQNGNETGVDCGGSCQKLCPSSFLPPAVSWARFEQVAPSLYNLAAYVVNPNPDAGASDVPYHMALYDTKGVSITDVYGTVTLPPHRNTLAFQSAVNIEKRTPGRLLFEFTSAPDWVSEQDTLSALQVGDKNYQEGSTSSSLTVKVTNTGPTPIDNVGVYAVLYDKDDNVLDFSKTALDQVPAQSSVLAPFTWPVGHGGQVISIEVLPVAQ